MKTDNVIEIKAFFSVKNHFSCHSVNCLEYKTSQFFFTVCFFLPLW